MRHSSSGLTRVHRASSRNRTPMPARRQRIPCKKTPHQLTPLPSPPHPRQRGTGEPAGGARIPPESRRRRPVPQNPRPLLRLHPLTGRSPPPTPLAPPCLPFLRLCCCSLCPAAAQALPAPPLPCFGLRVVAGWLGRACDGGDRVTGGGGEGRGVCIWSGCWSSCGG